MLLLLLLLHSAVYGTAWLFTLLANAQAPNAAAT